MSSLKGALKLTAFFGLYFMLLPFQALLYVSCRRSKIAFVIPWLYHTLSCKILGLKVTCTGSPRKNAQVLFASNHLSSFDITVLGSVLFGASFIAKSDIKDWAIYKTMAKLQQTVFIERARSAARKETGSLSEALSGGRNLILFPEGTSADGLKVSR